MLDDTFKSGYPFYDPKNFQHGFGRSGHFCRTEGDLLTEGGVVASQLLAGEIAPQSIAQAQFLKVCRGEAEASNEFEKVWLKYVDLIGRKRFIVSFGASGNFESAGSDEFESETLD
jgi:uncharacterized protein YifE (UPF0438 family)